MPFVSSTAPCCEDERLVHFPHVCRRNAPSLGKQPPGLCKCRATSHPQLIGLGEHNLQDWHESRGLAEVTGADNVCVDVQSLLVVAGFDALHDVVQATNDGWRECLFPKFVIQKLQALVCIIQLPLGLLQDK